LFSAEQPPRRVGRNPPGAVEHHRLCDVDIVELTAVLSGAGLGRLTDDLATSDVALELVGELAFFACQSPMVTGWSTTTLSGV
jgi:hypothetical protein